MPELLYFDVPAALLEKYSPTPNQDLRHLANEINLDEPVTHGWLSTFDASGLSGIQHIDKIKCAWDRAETPPRHFIVSVYSHIAAVSALCARVTNDQDITVEQRGK